MHKSLNPCKQEKSKPLGGALLKKDGGSSSMFALINGLGIGRAPGGTSSPGGLIIGAVPGANLKTSIRNTQYYEIQPSGRWDVSFYILWSFFESRSSSWRSILAHITVLRGLSICFHRFHIQNLRIDNNDAKSVQK